MRIHLTLDPSHFVTAKPGGPSSSSKISGIGNGNTNGAGPLAQLGGEVVLVELQGELNWEGDKDGGVVGVLGLDRPDKPTLHLGPHHLLHGKFANLPKPLAVIRRAVAQKGKGELGAGEEVQGDLEEEEDLEDDEEGEGDDDVDDEEEAERARMTPGRPSRDQAGAKRRADYEANGTSAKRRKILGTDERRSNDDDEDDDMDPPLFPDRLLAGSEPITPERNGHAPSSSSPFLPPSSIKDFSSELDFSSPPASSPGSLALGDLVDDDEDEDDAEDEDEEDEPSKEEKEKEERRKVKIEAKRAERRATRPERTRVYEVVSVVRRKVVFALRPEPIVTATILPD